jgi:hypothetical protein
MKMNSLLKLKSSSVLKYALRASESNSCVRSFSTVDGTVKTPSASLSQFGGVHGTKSGTAKMW